MGYLATLNPLGYNPNQLDLFYLILGTMVARLKTTPGTRQTAHIYFERSNMHIYISTSLTWSPYISTR
jgi:hypothetical protein